MKHSLKVGFFFGSTSGIITTLGLIVGLYSSTQSIAAIIGGILTIAIADSFSDALGIHISEESENKHTEKEIWGSTISAFMAKFTFPLIFIIPFLLFQLLTAILVNIILGLFLLSVFSFILAKQQKKEPWKVILEHLIVALIVVTLTHFIGDWLSSRFA